MGNNTVQLVNRDGNRYRFEDLCRIDHAILEELFQRGTAPVLRDLVGWQYKGWNTSSVASLMGIRRFTKGFFIGESHRDDYAVIDGYNLWARQKGEPSENWQHADTYLSGRLPGPDRKDPRRHGFFKLMKASDSETETLHPHSILFDYTLYANPRTHGGRNLKDFMVQIYEDDTTLLVGKAYNAMGKARVPLPGFFVMTRAGKGPETLEVRL